MEIDARIDLHGLTQAAAHRELQSFLAASIERGRRMLLVITGRGPGGEGVLRLNVPRWLKEGGFGAHILAVSQAQARHGGDGALYVLLRRRR
jgi:DNA-nicking Smr family endonuclease